MKNRKRTVRDKTNTITELGSRHAKILSAIERYGLSDTKHLCLLTGLSEDNIEEPIRQLFDAGLIDRLSNRLYNRDRNTDAQVYGKNDKATDWLETNNLIPHRATWITQGGQASHNLKVCLALANLEAAFANEGLRFIPWEEIVWDAPEHTKKMKRPWRLTTDDYGHVEPDAIFSVATAEDYRRLIFLEINLSDHGAKAYHTKAAAYHDIIFKGIYKKQFAMEQWASVLTISTNPRQQEIMAEATQRKDPSYFKLMPQYGTFARAPSPAPTILQDWFWPTQPNTRIDIKEVI